MSRGERAVVAGNLSLSMRDNYEEHGVEEYYRKVGSTYRNPHYPGIRLCLFSWFSRWWQAEHPHIAQLSPDVIMLFDMACGSGEATLAFHEWCTTGKGLYRASKVAEDESKQHSIPSRTAQRKALVDVIPLDGTFPRPLVAAADPFTATAYRERTTFPCAELSFLDVAEGKIPSSAVNISNGRIQEVSDEPQEPGPVVEMVVCSFALHLVETPSSLFTLLWQLSLKARWLVILAPHKRPEIKESWGWSKWDSKDWKECSMSDSTGDILQQRVHCRVYRSLNV